MGHLKDPPMNQSGFNWMSQGGFVSTAHLAKEGPLTKLLQVGVIENPEVCVSCSPVCFKKLMERTSKKQHLKI